jgi:hypothetical protein
MTLWCHFCDVSRYGTYVACLTMSIAMINSVEFLISRARSEKQLGAIDT